MSIKGWVARYWRRWKDSMVGTEESRAVIERSLSSGPPSSGENVEARAEAMVRLQEEIDRLGWVMGSKVWLVASVGFGAGAAFVGGGAILVVTEPLVGTASILWGSLLCVWTGYGVSLERRRDRASRILHDQFRAVTGEDGGAGGETNALDAPGSIG